MSHRLHGWATLGLLALAAALGYRAWSRDAESNAASMTPAASSVGLDAGRAPESAAEEVPAPAGFEEPPDVAPPARAWPRIRHRARAGEVPEICRSPWPDMHARERSANAAGRRGPHGQTALMVAAESGSLMELRGLLSAGAGVDERDELNHTALTYAARRGRNAHVEALMRAGADARTRGLWDSEGGSMTALDAALLEGKTATARLIESEVLQSFLALEAADLSVIDEAGDTPLHWVARYADARAAQLLVQGGADLETQNCPARPGDERGLHQDDLRRATPLLVAVWAGNVGVARQLLESAANGRAVDERGRGAFHVMRHPESLALAAELLRAGADPALPDRDGKTPAEVLSASGLRAELTRALVALGRPMPSAPPTIADVIGVITRLGRVAAARDDDPEPVLSLLGSDALLVNETDARGRSALAEAAFRGLPRVAEALVARGARLDARDPVGATPLHLASEEQTIAALVRLGAKVDALDQSGATPLHWRAAAPGSLQAVTALVEAGANPRREDRAGRTPLKLARNAGSLEVSAYLEGLQ